MRGSVESRSQLDGYFRCDLGSAIHKAVNDLEVASDIVGEKSLRDIEWP